MLLAQYYSLNRNHAYRLGNILDISHSIKLGLSEYIIGHRFINFGTFSIKGLFDLEASLFKESKKCLIGVSPCILFLLNL